MTNTQGKVKSNSLSERIQSQAASIDQACFELAASVIAPTQLRRAFNQATRLALERLQRSNGQQPVSTRAIMAITLACPAYLLIQDGTGQLQSCFEVFRSSSNCYTLLHARLPEDFGFLKNKGLASELQPRLSRASASPLHLTTELKRYLGTNFEMWGWPLHSSRNGKFFALLIIDFSLFGFLASEKENEQQSQLWNDFHVPAAGVSQFEIDLASRTITLERGFLKTLGLTSRPHVRKLKLEAWLNALQPVDRLRFQETLASVRETSSAALAHRLNFQTPLGYRSVEFWGKVFRGRNGQARYLAGIALDVTTANTIRDILKNWWNEPTANHRALFRLGAAGEFLAVDSSLAHILGSSPQQLLQMKVWDLFEPGYREFYRQRLMRLLDPHLVNCGLKRVRDNQGNIRFLNVETYVSSAAGGKPAFFGFATDVTQSVEQSSDEFERRRLESLGRLARNIAHDLNNMLTLVRANLELIESASPSSQFRRELESMSTAVERMAVFTSKLLQYARTGKTELARVDLNQLLRRVAHFCSTVFPPVIQVELHAEASEHPIVWADEDQLFEVFWNLANNAPEAMPSGGTVSFNLQTVEVHREQAEALQVQPGRYARVAVKDTGIGIPQELQTRIFEPYFSTKSARGKGMGLAIVREIVRSHGGAVTLESVPGEGSTFYVYLPLAGQDG